MQRSCFNFFAIPQPKTRRVTLHLKTKLGNLGVEVGGIWAGQPLNGRTFQFAEGTSGNYIVYTDQIESKEIWVEKLN